MARGLPVTLSATLIGLAALPAAAAGHGPVAPVATDYQARVESQPAGVQVKVVDGYVRLWLRVPVRQTVAVLDYRGAPYLRFLRGRVEVNEHSSMYFLNQTPVAQVPPADLDRFTPPDWQPASSTDAYEWHDGRLQALADVPVAPGKSYVGRWTIPVVVDGHSEAILGGLFYAGGPSIVWFWPIVVLLACLPAAWRLRSPELLIARVLAILTLAGLVVAGVARYLHGRPAVAIVQWGELGLLVAFAAWALRRLLTGAATTSTYFLIAFFALYEGLSLLPTLLSGFVLVALPAFVTRMATLLCLAGGIGLLLLVFRPSGLAATGAGRGRQRLPAA